MLDQVLKLLPRLSPAELQEVRQRVAALATVGAVDNDDDWLLSGIIELLKERGLGETIPPYFKVTNRRQCHGYLNKAEKVRNTFAEQFPDMTKIEGLALGKLLARCLADYVEDHHAVTLNSLLYNVHLCFLAFDRAFPGYLQSGLARVLLRGIK